MSFDIDIKDFGAMSEAEKRFVASATRMDNEVQGLIKRLGAVEWEDTARAEFQKIHRKWVITHQELKDALVQIAKNCGDVRVNTMETDQHIATKIIPA